MKKLGLCMSLCLNVFITSLSAQEAWSLEACINHAIKYNVSIQQIQLDVESNKIQLNTSQMSRLPNLNASASQSFGFGRSSDREGIMRDQSSSNTSLGVGASLNLFSGLRTTRQIELNKLQLAASMTNLDKAKEDLSLQITGFYLDVLFMKKLREISIYQSELTQAQLINTEKLVKAGKKPVSEAYDAKAQMALRNQQYVESNNNYESALLNLIQAINIEKTIQEFDIADIPTQWTEQDHKIPNPELVYAYSLSHRPGIKAQQLNVESATKSIAIAKSGYYPTLGLNGGYNTNYFYNYNLMEGMKNDQFKYQLKNNASQNIGISLSIPIFNRFATRNNVRQAVVSSKNQKLMLLKAEQDLYKEIQQAHQNAQASRMKHTAAQSSAQASKLAYEMEQKRYNIGDGTYLELQNAENRMIESNAQLAQAQYEWIFRYKILEFYQGGKLTF